MSSPLDKKPVKVKLVGLLGMNSMTMGPNFHIIDHNSLADPLMTRMPLYDVNKWRIGHFRHITPNGYMETLKAVENLIRMKTSPLTTNCHSSSGAICGIGSESWKSGI